MMRPITPPAYTGRSASKLQINVDKRTGALTTLLADGKDIFKQALRLNIMRYIDNDRKLFPKWTEKYHLDECQMHVFSWEERSNGYHIKGYLAAECMAPAAEFVLDYQVEGNTLTVGVEYKLADYVKNLPRFGFEFGVSNVHSAFSYVGFGPCESYVDKCVSAHYNYFESTAQKNFEYGYARPQECGSHYACTYLAVKNLFRMTADAPFSCSVLPYTTDQLIETTHVFDLEENYFVNVCVDLAMRGIGSASCGPALDEKYEIPRSGKNTFHFVF